jgi:hypothetical protein
MTERDDEDDVTIWAGRLRAWPTPDPAGSGRETDADLEDATALVERDAGPRRRGPAPAPHDAEAPVDSTAVVPRHPRRRVDPAPVPQAAPEARRVARIPEAGSREIYRPRLSEPEIVERRPPGPRTPQHPAAGIPTPRRRRRRRRTAAIVVVAVAVTALLAAILVLVLALS